MSAKNFTNTRFQVNGETRISCSQWEREDGTFNQSVAILRKVGRKWNVDGETCQDFQTCFPAEFPGWNLAMNHAYILALQEMGGEIPLMFFRDNKI